MIDLNTRRNLLESLKASSGDGLPILSIPVGCPVEMLLRPVSCNRDHIRINDIRILTKLRNRHVRSFLTEFEATESRTERWLTDIVGPDDTKILFMIDDLANSTIGYMGLAFINWEKGHAEADAIVRGDYSAPGAMTKALQAMLKWTQSQLGLNDIGVRVRSDNFALNFYRKAGFQEVKRVPLRKEVESEMIKWVEDKSVSFSELDLVYLEYKSSII
jgi:RimJ/RimL family protein N-acetyltransferase